MTNLTVVSKLRRAVKKIKVLLHYSLNKWRLISIISAAAAARNSMRRRVMSFSDRPGLRACIDDGGDQEASSGTSSSNTSLTLRRATSYQSRSSSASSSSSPGDPDIDKKAELFIANFYRQMQLERQISLELRYARGPSFTSSSSSSSSSSWPLRISP